MGLCGVALDGDIMEDFGASWRVGGDKWKVDDDVTSICFSFLAKEMSIFCACPQKITNHKQSQATRKQPCR